MRVAALLCASVVLALSATGARAAITVNTPTDESTGGDGACSLREAISAAGNPAVASSDCPGAAATGTTDIVLTPGAYPLMPGHPLTVAAGNMSVHSTSPDASQTVIDAGDDAAAADRGHTLVVLAGAQVTLTGLTVTGGWTADGTPGGDGSGGSGGSGASGSPGGGIENFGTLSLDDAVVTGNRTGVGGTGGNGSAGFAGGAGGDGGAGGGIFNFATLTATDTVISGNATGSGGGAGRGGAEFDAWGPGGTGGAGGGIENVGNASLTRTGVSGNATGAGGNTGGIVVSPSPGIGGSGGGIANAGTLNVQAATVAHNTAGGGAASGAGGSGGGIANTGMLTLEASTVSGNAAGAGGTSQGLVPRPNGGDGGTGGGIFDSGTATLGNVTLAANNAGTGGTGADVSTGIGTAGNGGAGGGGGAIEYVNPGSMSLTAVTITQNATGRPGAGGAAGPSGQPGALGAAGVGGAIEDAGASITETSTLIATNSRPMCAGAPMSGGFDLDFPPIDPSCPGTNGDPRLGTLSSAGGLAQTVPLGPGSAAIDQVPPGPACPSVDERAVTRPWPAGGMCDIGAYEASGNPGAPAPGATSTAGGGGSTASPPAIPPVITGLRISPRVFPDRPARPVRAHHRKTGATVTYTDSQAAVTTFTVLALEPGTLLGHRCVALRAGHRAHHPTCTRAVAIGAFRRLDRAGANQFRFSGVLGARPLPAGRFRLQAVPVMSGLPGASVTASFMIAR